jgi:hypothetical protein
LIVYPEKYAMTMSSTPGIRISAQYSGIADKVSYSTTNGTLIRWDSTTGKITECGQDVELPADTPIYWNPSKDNGLPAVTDKISIKVTILNKNNKVTERQVNISYDGSMYFTVQTSENVVISEDLQLQSQQ